MSLKKIVLPMGARLGLGFAALLVLMCSVATLNAISLTQLIGATGELPALQSQLQQQRSQLGATAAVALLIGVLLAWRCVCSLTHPLRAVLDQAWRLAGGDLAVLVVRDRCDELGELQQALGCLQEQLRHIEQLRRLMLQVRDGCEVLGSGPNLFNAANAAQLELTHPNPVLASAGTDTRQRSRSTSIT